MTRVERRTILQVEWRRANVTILLTFALILLTLPACSTNEPANSEASPSPALATATPEIQQFKLVAVGDSLTEGLGVDPEDSYPAQLEARLQAEGLNWQVINAGISGETSSGAKDRLNWILKTKPQAIILITGANDALRGVDPKIAEENIDFIITQVKAKDVKILLGGMRAPPNFGEDYVKEFEAIYPRLAEKHELPLIPFFLKDVAKVPELNQEDGKHPNPDGYAKLVENISPQVIDWLKK